MSETLHGLYADDPADLIIIARALDALEREQKQNAAYLPPRALEMRHRVAQLLGLSETGPRRERSVERNPQDVGNASSGNLDLVMTVQATAGILRKSEQMVRRDCASGRLTAVKDDHGSWLITTESVAAQAKGNR
jgi:hypothetical protein